MAEDSTTIELSRSELREVAGYAVACARPALVIFERARLTIGAHERRSTLRRHSRTEASEPRRYVTAHGRPTGRLRKPAMRDRLRRATLRARPATRWVRRSSTPCQKLLRSSTSSDRPLMPHERSNSPPETIPPSDSTRSRSPGSLRLPS